MDLEVVKKMFEKSIHAMNNVDPTEIENEDNSIRTRPNPINPPTKSSVSKKANGNVSPKDSSSKQTCTIS